MWIKEFIYAFTVLFLIITIKFTSLFYKKKFNHNFRKFYFKNATRSGCFFIVVVVVKYPKYEKKTQDKKIKSTKIKRT